MSGVQVKLDRESLSTDIESLKKGTIKTSKDEAKYTILLLERPGNDVDHSDFHTLDHINERGGAHNQSQTNSAHLYEITA